MHPLELGVRLQHMAHNVALEVWQSEGCAHGVVPPGQRARVAGWLTQLSSHWVLTLVSMQACEWVLVCWAFACMMTAGCLEGYAVVVLGSKGGDAPHMSPTMLDKVGPGWQCATLCVHVCVHVPQPLCRRLDCPLPLFLMHH